MLKNLSLHSHRRSILFGLFTLMVFVSCGTVLQSASRVSKTGDGSRPALNRYFSSVSCVSDDGVGPAVHPSPQGKLMGAVAPYSQMSKKPAITLTEGPTTFFVDTEEAGAKTTFSLSDAFVAAAAFSYPESSSQPFWFQKGTEILGVDHHRSPIYLAPKTGENAQNYFRDYAGLTRFLLSNKRYEHPCNQSLDEHLCSEYISDGTRELSKRACSAASSGETEEALRLLASAIIALHTNIIYHAEHDQDCKYSENELVQGVMIHAGRWQKTVLDTLEDAGKVPTDSEMGAILLSDVSLDAMSADARDAVSCLSASCRRHYGYSLAIIRDKIKRLRGYADLVGNETVPEDMICRLSSDNGVA